jgi:SAM-dependent methyltransferase
MSNADSFFKTYAPHFPDGGRVVEIGSQDVNGSIRTVCPSRFEYVGVDFCAGKGVDLVIDDPYKLPFEDGVADIVVSSSCFEHSEFFWLVFLEIMRCLKPHGLFYLNAPSTGEFHRYPVDCWRFYPDSALAMANWGKRNGLNCAVLESYIQAGGQFNDFVSVFVRDAAFAGKYAPKIIDAKTDFENGVAYGEQKFRNHMALTQYERRMRAIGGIVTGNIVVK